MQLTGQNLHNEHAQCDMRGDTNFKGSDSSDPTVYSLYWDGEHVFLRDLYFLTIPCFMKVL